VSNENLKNAIFRIVGMAMGVIGAIFVKVLENVVLVHTVPTISHTML